MSAYSLPPELWNNIAQHCRRRDLRSLAVTNTIAVNATRPVLFEKLVVEQRSLRSNPAMFDLLQRDGALCASVRSIKLVTHDRRNTGWISVEFMTRFIHADAIALEGWPFGESEQEEKAFLQLMCSGQWRSFAYKEIVRDEPNFDAMGWGAITGLRRIVFESPRTIEHSSMFLRASASSITHLTLPREMVEIHAAILESMLVTDGVRFPNLEFFECGTYLMYEDESNPHNVADCITRLLSYHPSIRQLRIPCYPWTGDEPTLDIGNMRPDFLPLLRKMELPMDAIELMAMARVKSLSTVEEVITGDWEYLDTCCVSDDDNYLVVVRNMYQFLRALLKCGGLPAVKRFEIAVGYKDKIARHSRIVNDQMQLMAKILPVVEEWTGNGNGLDDATEEDLVEMFKTYSPTLKTIRLRGMDVDRSAMRAIARAVPALERFCFDNPEDVRDDEWLTFDIIRLTNNRIVFSEGSISES